MFFKLKKLIRILKQVKEANEVKYWLRLLKAAEVISNDISQPLEEEAEEMRKILTAILTTAYQNQQK